MFIYYATDNKNVCILKIRYNNYIMMYMIPSLRHQEGGSNKVKIITKSRYLTPLKKTGPRSHFLSCTCRFQLEVPRDTSFQDVLGGESVLKTRYRSILGSLV